MSRTTFGLLGLRDEVTLLSAVIGPLLGIVAGFLVGIIIEPDVLWPRLLAGAIGFMTGLYVFRLLMWAAPRLVAARGEVELTETALRVFRSQSPVEYTPDSVVKVTVAPRFRGRQFLVVVELGVPVVYVGPFESSQVAHEALNTLVEWSRGCSASQSDAARSAIRPGLTV